MKKIILIAGALLALMAVVALATYFLSYNYTILIFRGTMEETDGSNNEYQYKEVRMKDPQAPHSVTLRINGVDITGTYVETRSSWMSNSLYRIYENERGLESIRLNEKGELRNFFWMDGVGSPEKIYSKEECAEIAREFLADYVDVRDYTVEINSYPKNEDQWEIVFTKYIAGFKTCDQAEMRVRCDGIITCFNSTALGEIPRNTPIVFDKTTSQIALRRKLDTSLESDVENYSGYSELEWDRRIFLLENGEPALFCIARYSLNEAPGDEFGHHHDRARAFVVFQTKGQRATQIAVYFVGCVVCIAAAVFPFVGVCKKRRAGRSDA